MTQETTMQTEPMNVDTKDLSCAEALELAIAETRLALCELGDAADLNSSDIEIAYGKVDAGLDRCKAAADGLAAYSRVLEMANQAAGVQLRETKRSLKHFTRYRDEADQVIEDQAMRLAAMKQSPQDRQAEHYDRRPNLKCAAWVIGLVLLGACIEAANGLLGRLL